MKHENARRSLCAFTGTRAEYGLLRPVLKALPHAEFDVPLLVSGTHLAQSFGLTVRDILNDGLSIKEQIEIPLEARTPSDVCASMGIAISRYGEALARLSPDCLMVLGDRYEAFAAAAAGTVHNIPIIHIHGGEVTEGAIDDSFRHAITKMSHVHFASTEVYRNRIIQLGEDPSRVHNVGALGVANALALPLFGREEVEQRLHLAAGQPYFLVTFHPETRSRASVDQQLRELIGALEDFPDHVLIFTGANADAGGASINQFLSGYAEQRPNRARFFVSLGSLAYLSSAKHARIVIGNSSSAIIEVPSFGVPTVDVGTRQAGRVRSRSVISCEPVRPGIARAINLALSDGFRAVAATAANPYHRDNTVREIVTTLRSIEFGELRGKRFFDHPVASTK